MKKITLGICAYNEEESIAKAIRSIQGQLSKNDEILVVADGCTDNTCKIVNNLIKKDKRIRLIEVKQRNGKGAAQIRLVKNAKGQKIVLIDADVIVKEGAIKKLLPYLDNKKVGAVIGKTISYDQSSLPAKLQSFGWEVLDEKRKKQSSDNSLFCLNGNLFAIRKDSFVEFDTNNAIEDALLGWEIKKKGLKIVYEPKAEVIVNPAHTWKDYFNEKKRTRYGWWQMKQQGAKLTQERDFSDLKYLFKNQYASLYLLFDMIAWATAFIDFKTKKDMKQVWKKIDSSKI